MVWRWLAHQIGPAVTSALRRLTMRVLVIGGKGTIGKAVVKQLSKRHEVLGAGRTSERFPIDMTSPQAIRALFDATTDLDAVVCTAGLGAGDGAFKPLDKLTD